MLSSLAVTLAEQGVSIEITPETRAFLAQCGRKGGLVRSEAKSRAAKERGAKLRKPKAPPRPVGHPGGVVMMLKKPLPVELSRRAPLVLVEKK